MSRKACISRDSLTAFGADLCASQYDGYVNVSSRHDELSPEVQYAKGYEDGIKTAMKLLRQLLEK